MRANKKILFLCNEASRTGAPLFLMNFVRFLTRDASGYDVQVFFCQDGDLNVLPYCEHATVHYSRKRVARGSLFRKGVVRFLHYLRLIKTLWTERPDLVYSNTITNFGETAIASRLGFTVCVHVHEGFDWMSANSKRVIQSVRNAHHFIVGSDYARVSLKKISGRDGVVVYNGTDLQVREPSEREHTSRPDVFRMGILGTMWRNKGQLIAVHAVEILLNRGCKVELMLAGSNQDDEYVSEITEFIEKKQLHMSISILGPVENAGRFIHSLDVLLVPSLDEAFPTVILEAFSVATPVIAANVGGIPELIVEGETGLLFERANSDSLANTVEHLLVDRQLGSRLAAKAFSRFESRFERNITHRSLATHLAALLESH